MKLPARSFALSVLLVAALCLLLPAAPLHAQATKIFVASYGDDANDGSRGSPMRNFQAAHNAVGAGGQIVVLDTAGYGQLNIGKSVSITVPPGVNGFVTATGNSNGLAIAAASASVALRGLIIEGGSNGNPGSGGTGISVTTVGNLTVEDCTVRNFNAGILVSTTQPAKCYLHDCTVRGCFNGLSVVSNAGGVAAVATGCRVEQNLNVGASAQGLASADLTLVDCVISGNATGIASQFAAALVRVDNCCITSNNTNGVTSSSGGQIVSRGNNTLESNGGNNAFPGTYSAK
ncbi:MAG: right-handed parallel beta-helix repeat-containing protein [Verrucomicrobia bacterium]|nr:right-handed parallel beta-helix repeat-containing protein [Verrucomicrobiota bacterium]